MTDTSPTPPTGSGQFCGECGAALLPDATFCGECGAATSFADADGPDAGAPGEAGNGASKWDDVGTVVDRPDGPVAGEPPTGPATVPVPNVPPPPGPAGPPGGAPPTGPPTGGPPPGAAEPDKETKGKGPKVLIALLVLAALIGGAFVFLGGDDDDGGDDDAAIDRDEDEDPDDEDPDDETTTAPDDEETTTTAPDDEETTTAPAVGFVNLVDDTGRISVDVPNDWLDISRAPADGLPRILAAPDAQAFETGFNVPGVDVRLIDSPPPPEQFDSSLDTVADSIGLPNSCTSQGKQDYAEGAFTGRIEVWAECAGVGTQMALVFAQQADGQTVFIGLQLTSSDDPTIADQVSASVAITG